MIKKTVCVLGGSGFVGRHICSQLVRAGYRVRVLSRRRDHCQHLSVLPELEIIETNVHDQHQLDQQFQNVDVVINLVGILNERGHSGDGFRTAHVDLTRKVLNACHHNKVGRLLHMSALNADASQGPSHYLRTKGEAENLVHSFAGKIHVTSFRPSVIFGPDDSFFNRFAGLLKLTPGIFPLACANARFAPVYVGDVARCFVNAIERTDTYDQRYDLCGPEEFTLKQLVSLTSQQLGRKHWIVALPDLLSKLQAIALEFVPGKPFSLDNYHSLQVDSICKGKTSAPCKLEHSPHSVVPWFLGESSWQKRADNFRQQSRRGK